MSCGSDGEDFLLNYTRAVVWEGLYHMARRDAIQEGDGDAMTDFWKMDLVLLWTRDHLQLFNKGHQMITGTSHTGPAHWAPEDREGSHRPRPLGPRRQGGVTQAPPTGPQRAGRGHTGPAL